MSGLLHLVEAATALTQLLAPENLHHRQPPSSCTAPSPLPCPAVSTTVGSLASASPFYRRVSALSTHTISDDNNVTSKTAACAKMAALRENHLQALRDAASDAGVQLPAPTQAVHPTAPQVIAYPSQQPVVTSPPATTVEAPRPRQTSTSPMIPAQVADSSREMFPMRLHALLADPTVRDVISWLPHGRSFVVLRPDVFATRVLPRYFAPEGSNSLNAKTTTVVGKDGSLQVKNRSPGVHKYPSFTRKLNRWGFRQISRGPDAGAFCHEMFQRDRLELCRGMVCQKSRKSKRAPVSASGIMPDDMMSISSASTMGTRHSAASGEKRPYSSTVTVSTAGVTSNKSLPFKKRKSSQMFMMNDIPSMISHRPQKMQPSSTSSVTESDLTSDNGSVCSNNLVIPKATTKAHVQATNSALSTAATSNAAPTAHATAMEALLRHFHEQHRAFALASLMENSRVAMEAAGISNQAGGSEICSITVPQSSAGSPSSMQPPVVGALTTHSPAVFAATVNVSEDRKMTSAAVAKHALSVSGADSAKSALYKAYLQALSNHTPSS